MKHVNRTSRASLLAALLAWLLFSALAVFIIGGYRDRARLIRDGDNERILNILFAGLREHDDYGDAIADSETLRQRIAGFAVYDSDRVLIQSWGKVPQEFDASLITGGTPRRFNRYTIPSRRSGSIKFVIHNDRQQPQPEQTVRPGRPPPPPVPEAPGGTPNGARTGERRLQRESAWYSVFSRGNYVYIDIKHPAYWRAVTVTNILYPVSAAALLALVLAVRRLYVRNVEYRERIEAQGNLVVLGTAASTLAHEIKNPLHSIKLQTGILEKMFGASEEITRINEEVDRLAALTWRVNDYLRDARGNPETTDIAAVIEECSRRVCGRSILEGGSLPPQRPTVLIDSERAKSVFENIIVNALESGGPPEECRAVLEIDGKTLLASVRDRGRGVAAADMRRVFDPFFTTKSSGTGIGLAVSRRFVEAAGGSISLENRPGGGAAVIVRLPLADSP